MGKPDAVTIVLELWAEDAPVKDIEYALRHLRGIDHAKYRELRDALGFEYLG